MPYIEIWIHLIWTTKNRHPFLQDSVRPIIIRHIRDNARKKGISLDFINGYKDHLHLLISLRADQSIAKVAKLLKGESSRWINKQKLVKGVFSW